MLAKIEARILTFPDTNFNFPSTSVPRHVFLALDVAGTQRTFFAKAANLGKRVFVHQWIFTIWKLFLQLEMNTSAKFSTQ